MSTDDAWRPRLASRARLKFDPVAKQEMLLFPEAALALNETGAAIVRLCDGARSIDEIVDQLSKKYRQRRSRRADARGDGLPRHDSRARVAPMTVAPRPYTLVAELTYRCPLRCVYCSNPVDFHRSRTELSTDEWRRVFSEAAQLGVMQLHLSGGEPVLRDDLIELIRHARALRSLHQPDNRRHAARRG